MKTPISCSFFWYTAAKNRSFAEFLGLGMESPASAEAPLHGFQPFSAGDAAHGHRECQQAFFRNFVGTFEAKSIALIVFVRFFVWRQICLFLFDEADAVRHLVSGGYIGRVGQVFAEVYLFHVDHLYKGLSS